jgi:putative drug exporter of the RND superfamily
VTASARRPTGESEGANIGLTLRIEGPVGLHNGARGDLTEAVSTTSARGDTVAISFGRDAKSASSGNAQMTNSADATTLSRRRSIALVTSAAIRKALSSLPSSEESRSTMVSDSTCPASTDRINFPTAPSPKRTAGPKARRPVNGVDQSAGSRPWPQTYQPPRIRFHLTLKASVGRIAAGTDYGIFFIGRYQEARQAGEDRETAFYTTYRGVAHVVLASGLTIAGAVFCLSFTRLPVFRPLGVSCGVGLLVAVAVALTLVPAVIAVGSRFGLFDPKRMIRVCGWRRVGTAIVRWPAPILAGACAIALIGLLALPGYKTNLNDRLSIPKYIPANLGYAAAERHFPEARMMPEILLVEADHDLRNPADFLVLNRLAKGIFAVQGISRVQAITRPEGTPIEHTSIPFLLSMQNAGQIQSMKFQKARMNDVLKQADALGKTINVMQRMYGLLQQLTNTTHHLIGETKEIVSITGELRDNIADFDDVWRPVRSYFYWEKHCYDIPICWSLRSTFDALDGVDEISDKLQDLVKDLDKLDALLPQMVTLFPPMIETMQSMRSMMLTMNTTMSGMFAQMDDMGSNASAMGKAFDASKNDDSFYLPPDVFQNKDFKRAMNLFLSPDGKAVRMVILHRDNPLTPEGMSRIGAIKTAAEEALKGTPVENAKIYLTGTAATVKDTWEGSKYDLLIAGVAALCLIFIIMLIITRSFIATLVIVGTVVLSLGASFGLSVTRLAVYFRHRITLGRSRDVCSRPVGRGF